MIDKSLVKKRFSKSLKTYDDNAIVQKQMAEKLVDFLPRKEFVSVLEIGCATGVLTREINSKLKFENYTANDIVEASEGYVTEIVPNCEFITGDIEHLNLDKKYDLIISNACLQWCSNVEDTILKLKDSLNGGGVLAVSVFGSENIKEIKQLFNLELKTLDTGKLPFNTLIVEEKINLFFDTPIEVLKHLKYTGANAVKEMKLTKSMLQNFEEKYIEYFSCGDKVQLTYNPVYVILQ